MLHQLRLRRPARIQVGGACLAVLALMGCGGGRASAEAEVTAAATQPAATVSAVVAADTPGMVMSVPIAIETTANMVDTTLATPRAAPAPPANPVEPAATNTPVPQVAPVVPVAPVTPVVPVAPTTTIAPPATATAKPAVTTALDGTIRIMPLGDSITACCWSDKLYLSLLAERLKVDIIGTNQETTPRAGQDYDNEGHGGYAAIFALIPPGVGPVNASGYYADVRDLGVWFGPLAMTPDVLLIHFGTNDIWGGHAPTKILEGYSVMLAAARAKNPRLTVLVAQIIPGSSLDVRPLNALIPGWAEANSTAASRILVVDQYTGFDLALTMDGAHPNPTTGAQRLSDRWLATLVTILK